MGQTVNKKEYRKRVIDETIERYLRVRRAIYIEGPKWCGKTWASSYHSNNEIINYKHF